jgi:hypothetical protein
MIDLTRMRLGRPSSRMPASMAALERDEVVGVVHVADVPAIGLEAPVDVLRGEAPVRGPVQRDVVVS